MKITLSNTKDPQWDDDGNHDHYKVTLATPHGRYTFDFFQSIHGTQNKQIPTEYDVMACLDFNIPETLEEFCGEFGYPIASVYEFNKAKKTWKACLVQSRSLKRIFPSQAQQDLLSEIR